MELPYTMLYDQDDLSSDQENDGTNLEMDTVLSVSSDQVDDDDSGNELEDQASSQSQSREQQEVWKDNSIEDDDDDVLL